MAHKRRILSDQKKADLISGFDALPEGKTGERGDYIRKHRLSWRMMTGWRNDPAVKALISVPHPSPAPQFQLPATLPDAGAPMNIPELVEGRKRRLTLRTKAWLVASWDALPLGSDARGEFIRKYHLHWGMLDRWRKDLKREGIPLPNLKVKPVMNGAAPRKPGRKPKQTAKAEKQTGFDSVHDTIAWLEIRNEIRREVEEKILEELKEHASKTRHE